MDTAGSLALLQEEVLEDCRVVDHPHFESSGSTYSHATLKTAFPSVPTVSNRAVHPNVMADKHGGEVVKSQPGSGS